MNSLHNTQRLRFLCRSEVDLLFKVTVSPEYFIPSLEIISMPLLNDAHLQTTFWPPNSIASDAFHKSTFYSHYVKLLHDDERKQ